MKGPSPLRSIRQDLFLLSFISFHFCRARTEEPNLKFSLKFVERPPPERDIMIYERYLDFLVYFLFLSSYPLPPSRFTRNSPKTGAGSVSGQF